MRNIITRAFAHNVHNGIPTITVITIKRLACLFKTCKKNAKNLTEHQRLAHRRARCQILTVSQVKCTASDEPELNQLYAILGTVNFIGRSHQWKRWHPIRTHYGKCPTHTNNNYSVQLPVCSAVQQRFALRSLYRRHTGHARDYWSDMYRRNSTR